MKKVAVILLNYGDYAEKYLAECLAGIRTQRFEGEIKLYIVDNATSDKSFQYISGIAPEAELILNKTNDGFAKGNNDAIRLALAKGFDHIVLFNLDTVIDSLCIDEMVSVAEADDKIGAVQARMMLYPDTDRINSLGNVTHFLGFGYSLGYKDKYEDENNSVILEGVPMQSGRPIESRDSGCYPLRRYFSEASRSSAPGRIRSSMTSEFGIAYPSGAAVLFKAEVLKKVGLFDEEFWMYNEDQDLGWRIWLAGYKCVLAPNAVVYHKYEFNRSAGKFYWLDRNRIISIWKNYHLLTLLLILPAFIIMEFGLIIFSFQSGWYKEKLKVWKYFFSPLHWSYLFRARRETQKLRKAKDSEIIKLFSGKIWYQEIDDLKLRIINPIFDLYWRIAKFIVIW